MKKSAYFLTLLLVFSGCGGQGEAPGEAPAAMSEGVEVGQGLLTGTTSADGDVLIFKGVPFAAPPVGPLRWQPPQPAAAWSGERAADAFGASCIQNLARTRAPWTEPFMVQGDADEDCLYLNVWTAVENASASSPVLVYIHGGGFNEGSGSIDTYDGEALARKGTVVVTINYRVGPLGLLAHPALTSESEHGASGNYGLLDQVAALEWVQENIEAFGGDPNRVTVAGQSAGAISVILLTASPMAEGLFHRAIIQSGPGALASFGVVGYENLAGPLSEAERAGEQFAANMGVESLEDLRALTPDEIMETTEGVPPVRFRPVVDGWFLPDNVADVYASGRMIDVPTMSGMNADEGSAFPGYGTTTLEAYRQEVRERYGDQADEFFGLYPAESDEEASRAQIDASRDRGLMAMQQIAEQRAATAETDLYLYYFERGIPWPEYPRFGAFHTSEVPYVFDNLSKLDRPWEDIDHRLAAVLSSYWANFAAQGDPNGADLPEWNPYGISTSPFMVLGDEIGMQQLPPPDRAAFVDSFLAARTGS